MQKFKFISLFVVLVAGIMSAAAVVNAQDATPDASTPVITLERTECHGTCPVYTVAIYADGKVVYEGKNFVDVTGEQTIEIDPATVQMMVEAFDRAGYFDWNEAYDTQTVTDLPTVITSVTRNGETHRIVRYAGDKTAPLALPFLEQWVDALAYVNGFTGVQTDLSAVSNGTDTPVVTLERGACFGDCPVYSVALFADGTGVYTGIANVDQPGVRVFEFDPSLIEGLVQRADILGYFTWNDSYDQYLMTDQTTVITSVRTADQTKRITRYNGDPNAPIGLVWIEDGIDQAIAEALK